MKFRTLIAATTLGLSGVVLAADDHKDHGHDSKAAKHPHEEKAQHGGVVSVVRDVNYEFVATPDELKLYVSDHGKAVELKGATAKVTLLSGSKKEEAILTAGTNALEAKGSFATKAGTKVVAQVALQGKSSHAVRFTLK